MNIRDHILRGHYEKGPRGFFMVPTTDNQIAEIYDAEFPHGIAGRLGSSVVIWTQDGERPSRDFPNLKLPPPQMLPIAMTLKAANPMCCGDWSVVEMSGIAGLPIGAVVHLKGEYEMPWEEPKS